MTDFRALCAELLAATDEYTGMNPYMRLDTAMKAARAALARPEPQGPGATDEEIEAAARVIYGSMRFDRIGYTEPWVERGNSFAQDEARRCARAVFARWGRSAKTESQGVTNAQIDELAAEYLDGDRASVRDFVRAVLARWGRPAIELVPVSERLPGPENCDAEGRCWGLTSTPHLDGCCYKTWKLVPCSWVGPGNTSTHWLPHWALPFPKVNNTGKTND